MRFAALLLLAAVLGGCRRGDPDDCRAVATHYASMVEAEVEDSGKAALIEETHTHLPALRDAVERACDDKKWPRSTRRCVLEAKSIQGLSDCDPAAAAPARLSEPQEGQKGSDE